LIRANVESWRTTILADNGPLLGRTARAISTKDCLPSKVFFDIIDGRATWRDREEMERHVRTCWHCLDYHCRLLEVVHILRASQPLPDSDVARYQRLLGIAPPQRSFWKRS
jgi:hypothetical protein